MTIETEHFGGSDLDVGRWMPYYLPHWSSRDLSRATYDVRGSVLRLMIPAEQGLWCQDRHLPPLRTSTVASGLYAGPLGSTTGQQPFRDGLTVSEEQEPFRGWLLGHGRISVTARAQVSPRSMVSVWLTGFEDRPERSGEVCVFEVFGDAIVEGSAGIGAGVHAFRDSALREDFSVTRAAVDVADWHRYDVEMRRDGCSWWVDDLPVRSTDQCPSYPLQIFVGVFDFPQRDQGGQRDHVPALEVDAISYEPAEGPA